MVHERYWRYAAFLAGVAVAVAAGWLIVARPLRLALGDATERAELERERAAELATALDASRTELDAAIGSLGRAEATGDRLARELAASVATSRRLRTELDSIRGILGDLGAGLTSGEGLAVQLADGIDGDLTLLDVARDAVRGALNLVDAVP